MKKIFVSLLCIVMMVTFMPSMAFAAAGSEGKTVVNTYEELKAALESGGDVELGSNFSTNDSVEITITNPVNLDLKGYTVTSNASVINHFMMVIKDGGALTIEDTVGTGKLEATNSSYGYGIKLYSNASLVMNQGTIETTQETVDIDSSASDVNVKINGGQLISKTDNVLGIRGSSNIHVEITGGIHTGNGRTGCYVSSYSADAINFVISGGSLTNNAGGRSGVIQIYGGANVTVKGNAVIEGIDCGSSITLQSGSAPAQLVVEGGTIIGKEWGCTGIRIEDNSELIVSGGEIKSEESYGIQVENNPNITIAGGKITTKSGCDNINIYHSSFDKEPSKPTILITGGNFSNPDSVKNHIPSGMETDENGDVVISTSAVAKVGNAGYSDLAAAIEAANNGGTVTLLKSIEIDTWNQIWGAKNLTIDGDNKTITINKIESGENGNYLFYGADNLKVKDLNVVFKEKGNGFDMNSGSLTNVNMTGGTNSKYAVYVGTSDLEKVTIDNCRFTNFDIAVYSQPSGKGNTPVSDIVIKNSDFNNCKIAMVSYAADTEFTGNIVKGSSEVSFAGSGDEANNKENVKSVVTGNTFENAGKVWFYGANLDKVEFKKNKATGNTVISTKEAENSGKLDVSENYWGGNKPSATQIEGDAVTGKDVYYEADTMRPQDMNTYIPPYFPPAPTVQKPTIEHDAHATVTLSKDGTTATITVAEGYELADVVLNGKSIGKETVVKNLKTGDKLVVTTAKKPAEFDVNAALDSLKLTARSSKTSKKNIKVVVKMDDQLKAAVEELKANGYTVKYKFYRSIKKASKYTGKLTKNDAVYTNTAGKKGTMYYYKARLQVYDAEGKLVDRTELKQCRYANRLWTK